MNTPKQKAKELIEKFKDYVIYDYDDTPFLDYQKECSLIAVEQMQLIMDSLWKIQGINEGKKSTYLLEVIKEIEKYERAS